MDQDIKEFEIVLGEVAAGLKDELATLRTNRPTAKLIEDIKADYYGQVMPLKALGTIGISPPREVNITVWDKNALGPVQKAIETSGIGMTPNVDGNTIRLNLPQLTDERRKDLVKLVGKMAEESKIKVRMSRDDMMKRVKTAEDESSISESEKFKLKDRIQEIVNKANNLIDDSLHGKIKEIEE